MNVTFKRMVARDTFAYKYLDFHFAAGIHSITGINGASKTSIFATLLQCLFNRNPKGITIENVNNDVTNEPYEIELWFDKGGIEHYIKNSKKTGNIEIKIGGADKHLKRIPDNLKLIEDIIGCDYVTAVDILYQSVESSINLLEVKSDGERKKFINRILRLDELDYHLKRMEDRAKELGGKNGRIALLNSKVTALEGGLLELLEELPETPTDELELAVATCEAAHIDAVQQAAAAGSNVNFQNSLIIETRKHAEAHQQIQELTARLQNLPVPTRTHAELEQRRDESNEQLRTLKTEQSAAAALYERAKQAVPLRDRLEQLRAKLAEIVEPEKTPDFIVANLEKLTALSTTTEANLNTALLSRKKLEQSAAKGACPTCGHSVAPDQFAAELAELQTTIDAANETLGKCTTALPKYRQMQQTWNDISNLKQEISVLEANPDLTLDVPAITVNVVTLDEQVALQVTKATHAAADVKLSNDRRELVEQLNKLKATVGTSGDLDEQEAEMDRLQGIADDAYTRREAAKLDLEGAKLELSTVINSNATARARKQLNQQAAANNQQIILQLDAARKELTDSERRLELVKSWVGILGSKGYRVHKINRFLDSLNKTMQAYSYLISSGRIQCRFFITEGGEIDFTITDAHKTKPYANWSAGEKARIKMACLFAVLELLELYGSISFNVLALDEIFGALDDEGKEGLFRVLKHLQGKGKCIYTICHSEIALDMVYDSTIKAIKNQDGTSSIIQ